MPAWEKKRLSSVATNASCTIFGISSIFTSVRFSRPSSEMNRPSTAYSFDVWCGVYSARISIEGHWFPRQINAQAE